MKSPSSLWSAAAAAVIALAVAAPTRGAEPDVDRFKAEIDAFVARLGPSSNGVAKWAGSDPYEIRRDGDALVAVITNGRLTFASQQVDRLALDHIEIRQIGEKEGGKLVELAVQLPNEMTLSEADGTETKIILKEGRVSALVEATSGRGRDTVIKIAGGRIDQPKTGAWISLGPLSMQSKFAAGPNQSWSGPVEFEASDIQYFLPQAPVGGAIDRIAFSGESAGPNFEQLNKLRNAIDRLQAEDGRSPEARGADFIADLPTIAAPFSTIRGEFGLEGLTVRSVTGEVLVSLAKAGSSAELAGLDNEMAALRFGLHHEGLDLAPSILDPAKVPHRVVLDLGVEELSMQALGKLLQAIGVVLTENGTGEDGEKSRQATQQMLGAAATLTPTFHVYQITANTEDVGIELTAEARGSPLAPKGYTARGDLLVRGFDEIAKFGSAAPFAEYLPILKELGVEERTPDGTPRIAFHLASVPPKWITINGNDVGAWFEGAEPQLGLPRLLRPADPPMQGNDVKSVQRALAGAKVAVEQNGLYDAATAAAVARFQKRQGINVSGIVDAATRQRLGLAPEGPRQGGRN